MAAFWLSLLYALGVYVDDSAHGPGAGGLATAPQVVLSIDAAEPRERLAIQQSCEQALGLGRCPLAIDTTSSAASSSWIHSPTGRRSTQAARALWARVSWDQNIEQVAIELYAYGDPKPPASPRGTPLVQRDLRFPTSAPLSARYEATGLVIASHVLSEWHKPSRMPSHARPPALASSTPLAASLPSNPGRRPRLRHWSLAGAVGVGPGLTRGPARWHGQLRLGFQPWKIPVIWVGQLAASRSFGALPLSGVALDLGLRTRWPLITGSLPLHFEAGLTLGAEYLHASTQDSASGMRDRATGVRWGARGALELHGCPHPRLCTFVGAQLGWLDPAFRLTVAGENAGRLTRLSSAAMLGTQWLF